MDILKRTIIVIFFLSSLALLLKTPFLDTYPDFNVYYEGSTFLFRGLNPYVSSDPSSVNYVYPPFALLFFAPFTLLPVFAASSIWTILSLISFFSSMMVAYKILSVRIFSNQFLLLTSLAMLFFPVKFTLGMGQINLFIFLLLLLGIYFLRQKKEIISGIFFGTSIALKFFPLLFLPYFLIKRQWQVFFSSLATVAFLWLFSVLFVGIDLQLYYINHVLPGIFKASQAAYYNQALSGFLVRLLGDNSIFNSGKLLISLLLLVLSFWILLKKEKRKDTTLLELSMIITLSLMVNSFSWQHHFVWLIFPFMIVAGRLGKWGGLGRLGVLVSYLLVAANLRNPSAFPLLVQSHVFFGTLLLWGVIFYLLIKRQYA